MLGRIVRNAASMLLGTAMGEVLTTYAIGLAAISLGAAGFGTFAAAQAFVDPFGSLAGFGLGSVAVMVAARRGGTDAALLGTLLALLAAASSIAGVVAIVLGAITGSVPLPLLSVAALGMVVGPLTLAASLPFQFDQAMHKLVAIPLLVSVVRIATAGAAYYLLRTPLGFQLSGTIAALASVALMFWASRRTYARSFAFDPVLAKELLALAWPAAVLEFVVMAYMRGSYFLLSGAGPTVQGEYAAADRLVRPFLGLSGALAASALPSIARIAAARDFARLRVLYAKTIVRCLAAIVPLSVAASFVAPWVVRRFAPEYAAATSPFRVLLVGILFMFVNQLSSTFIVAMGRFRLIMAVALVNFVVYVALAVSLIPRFGATGAAIATTVMEAVNTLMQIVIVVSLLRAEQKKGRP